MSIFFVKLIKFYKNYISPLKPSTCRFYPTCSEFAYLQFQHNSIFFAFTNSVFRILKCNKFFKGGFDYPIITKNIVETSIFYRKSSFKFWLIPYKKNKFYLVKTI